MQEDFRSYSLDFEENLFTSLATAVRFEQLSKGRQGAVLARQDDKRGTPIVRTTSMYEFAAQEFEEIYLLLGNRIRVEAELQDDFNNALVEIYSNDYYKMGAHSDQALDLEEGAFIALFSCYEHPESAIPPRKLVVKSKEPNAESFEVPLLHNSVVVFSLETNRRFRHKIVLDVSRGVEENQWLGVTFRRSKTFVHHRDSGTFFEDGTPISLASDEERQVFYKLRGEENRQSNFLYPQISYTISKSDLL